MGHRRRGTCFSVAPLTHYALLLGCTAARLKRRGIDGGPHKRWSMWFNSKQRAEPYQTLTWGVWAPETVSFSSAGSSTGAAWMSSARVVTTVVKYRNERNKPRQLHSVSQGTLPHMRVTRMRQAGGIVRAP